jgi:hypothetical protein
MQIFERLPFFEMRVVELGHTGTHSWKVEIEARLIFFYFKTFSFRLHFLSVDQRSPIEKESCALNADQQR